MDVSIFVSGMYQQPPSLIHNNVVAYVLAIIGCNLSSCQMLSKSVQHNKARRYKIISIYIIKLDLGVFTNVPKFIKRNRSWLFAKSLATEKVNFLTTRKYSNDVIITFNYSHFEEELSQKQTNVMGEGPPPHSFLLLQIRK